MLIISWLWFSWAISVVYFITACHKMAVSEGLVGQGEESSGVWLANLNLTLENIQMH